MADRAHLIDGNRERGAILVVVLWFVSIMALLVVSLGRDVRSNADLARLDVDQLRTSSALGSAVEVAAAMLLAAGDKPYTVADGGARTIDLGGTSVAIRIADAGGLVDIARAQPDLLRSVVDKVLGVGANSSALVDAILSRRPEIGKQTADELPFQSVEELYELAAGNPQLVDALMPYVGLYSKDGRINANSSPEAVIESTPGISGSDIDQILSLRHQGTGNAGVLQDVVARYSKYLSVESGNIFVVTAQLTEGRHVLAGSSLQVIIALDPKNPDAPYKVVNWSW